MLLKIVKQKAFDGRRIGLGVMGLAEYLFAKRVRYGSQESIRVITRLMENIRNYAYEASCKLSEEKEPFPKFDVKEYSKAHFFKTLPASIKNGYQETWHEKCFCYGSSTNRDNIITP
jgi:ribonucleoside-diphosphate reductase alpha chain